MARGEVQLVELVKRFGEFTAVAGISLQMPPGEFFSLLGPSGCGKTTTLRMIAGFERPSDGQILLDGVDVAQVPPQFQRRYPCSEASVMARWMRRLSGCLSRYGSRITGT